MQQTGERWAVGGGRWAAAGAVTGAWEGRKQRQGGSAVELGGVFSTWRRPDVHLSIPPPGQPYPARRLAHTQAGKSERWMFIEPIRSGPASVPKNRKEPVLSPTAVVTSYTPSAQAFSLISGGSRKTHGGRPLSTNQHTPPSITPSKHQTTGFPTQLQFAPRGICKAPRIDNWGTCIPYRLHIETRRTTATH
jgi:hypothetical protein